jgi:hypothetical protein
LRSKFVSSGIRGWEGWRSSRSVAPLPADSGWKKSRREPRRLFPFWAIAGQCAPDDGALGG